MKSFVIIILTGTVIFFTSWFAVKTVNINNLDIQSEDTVPAMFLPFSIIQKHTIYLDDFYLQMIKRYPQPDDKDYVKGNIPFYIEKVDQHYLSAFTIITPIVALPVYLIPIITGVTSDWNNLILLAHLSAALLMSLSGYILFKIAKDRYNIPLSNSYLITAIYLFGTINFALLSQALWQHGTLELLVLAGLYFYIGNTNLLLSSFFWGFAFLARPTALLPLVFLSLVNFFPLKNFKTNIKNGLLTIVGLLPALLFFIWYNGLFYKSISNQGYSSQLFTSWLGDFPISFFGVWLSPSKGILIYSPVLIFSFLGFILSIRQKRKDFITYGLIVLIHTLIISFWKHWYGGWSYGYRMSSDVIPFMVLLLIPFIQSDLFAKYSKLFTVLLVISVLVELAGIIFFDGVWHAAYDRGFHDTSWLWSIRDSEFLFNVRRVLVKLHLLDKACPKCLPM